MSMKKKSKFRWIVVILVLRLLIVDKQLVNWVKSLPFMKREAVYLMWDGTKYRLGMRK